MTSKTSTQLLIIGSVILILLSIATAMGAISLGANGRALATNYYLVLLSAVFGLSAIYLSYESGSGKGVQLFPTSRQSKILMYSIIIAIVAIIATAVILSAIATPVPHASSVATTATTSNTAGG
jgi:hypothetical protein